MEVRALIGKENFPVRIRLQLRPPSIGNTAEYPWEIIDKFYSITQMEISKDLCSRSRPTRSEKLDVWQRLKIGMVRKEETNGGEVRGGPNHS